MPPRNEPLRSPEPRLTLRVDAVRGAAAAHGVHGNEQLAIRLDQSLSTVKRVMSGEQQPSAAFIASVVVNLGLDFSLFLEATGRRSRTKVAA